jgi:seryl-tRNA synthetase
MKKVILVTMIGGTMLFAGPSNYVGLTDVKDALYYLIKDYNSLLKKNKYNKKNIMKLQENMNKEISSIKKTIKVRNIKVDNELKELLNKVNSLKKRALLIRKKEDKYDKYISSYVEENQNIILHKIK